ncbi:hypothetical protein FPV67DRAFT_1477594 [Lyophyllum atratum]|nr:hypothetical protein FPV67DRAFT_1477594 [Lyophyllum atratum]
MLTGLSSDVLVEICTRFDLEDVLSFLSVCPSLRRLTHSRYLWITVLEKTQAHRTLACPVGTDLSKIDIEDLCRIARRTHQVEKSLGQARITPRAVELISYMTFCPPDIEVRILAVIPATPLVILCSELDSYEQHIILCDIEGNTHLSSVSVGKIICHAHYDEAGRHLIAVADEEDEDGSQSDSQRSLRVFSIEYGASRQADIRQIFRSPMAPQDWEEIDELFLSKDVLGVIFWPRDDDTPRPIHAINILKNLTVDIPMTSDDQIRSCSVVDGTLFIVTTGLGYYGLHRCSAPVLRTGEDPQWENYATTGVVGDVVPFAEVYVPNDRWEDWGMLGPTWTSRGFHDLRIVHPGPYTWASFSPAETFQMSPEPCPQHFDRMLATKTINAETKGDEYYADHGVVKLRKAASPSGLYSIILNPNRGRDMLYLLQYDSDPPNIHIRQLDLPRNIHLDRVSSIAIDERHGVVYLSYAHQLLAVSYAWRPAFLAL